MGLTPTLTPREQEAAPRETQGLQNWRKCFPRKSQVSPSRRGVGCWAGKRAETMDAHHRALQRIAHCRHHVEWHCNDLVLGSQLGLEKV